MMKVQVIIGMIVLVVLTESHLTKIMKNYQRIEGAPEARVVGGEEAKRNEFPWMAMLSDKYLMFPGCGATLLNKRFVLTAGHCIQGTPLDSPRILRVLFGLHNSSWLSDPEVVVRAVRRIIPHPEYKPKHIHDFALMELDQDLELSHKIQPICLPPTNQDFTGEMATVLGWGRTAQGGNYSDILRKAPVPVTDQEYCRELLAPSLILDDMLCAGTNGKDACQRDSGGPLMWKGNSDVWHLIGVVSWGRGCANILFPGVYGRVTSVLPWIRSTIGQAYC